MLAAAAYKLTLYGMGRKYKWSDARPTSEYINHFNPASDELLQRLGQIYKARYGANSLQLNKGKKRCMAVGISLWLVMLAFGLKEVATEVRCGGQP